MKSTMVVLDEIRDTVQNVLDGPIVKTMSNVYAPLTIVMSDLDSLIESQRSERRAMEINADQVRSLVVQLAKYKDPQMLGLLKAKYGRKDFKQRVMSNDFTDDEIIEIWEDYMEEVSFDD